jgi:predicted transcriptional regulator of viral defense system
MLRSMPDRFTSKDFAAAASSGISSLYLRQMLTRWTKQGKLKRVERGKYHKTKKASADRLVSSLRSACGYLTPPRAVGTR